MRPPVHVVGSRAPYAYPKTGSPIWVDRDNSTPGVATGRRWAYNRAMSDQRIDHPGDKAATPSLEAQADGERQPPSSEPKSSGEVRPNVPPWDGSEVTSQGPRAVTIQGIVDHQQAELDQLWRAGFRPRPEASTGPREQAGETLALAAQMEAAAADLREQAAALISRANEMDAHRRRIERREPSITTEREEASHGWRAYLTERPTTWERADTEGEAIDKLFETIRATSGPDGQGEP